MCFGSSTAGGSDDAQAPPRPVRMTQQQQKPPQYQATSPVPLSIKNNNNGYEINQGNENISNNYITSSGPSAYKQYQPGEDCSPPPGPPPSHRQALSDFAPPPGPPPGRKQQKGHPLPSEKFSSHESDYAPPAASPPSHGGDYAPPPGPPPSHGSGFTFPPDPPPSNGQQQQQQQNKPLEPWEIAVPDTSLLPPPPDIFSGWDRSPANNSDEASSRAGEDWCARYPLVEKIQLDNTAWQALAAGNIRLIPPHGWERGSGGGRGSGIGSCQWVQGQPGVWNVTTPLGARDACLTAYPPLYSVSSHLPFPDGPAKMIYYECKFVENHQPGLKNEVSVAMGFSALPYPTFRLPGWHRGSLAVHGDDGHRYVNDTWGGKNFTQPFKKGSTYGIGMRFWVPLQDDSSHSLPRIWKEEKKRLEVEVFLTYDGTRINNWSLNETLDASSDRPVTGLQGLHDLAATIGIFDQTDFQVIFNPQIWLFDEARRAYGLT